MTKTIDTLAADINELLAQTQRGIGHTPSEDALVAYSIRAAKNVRRALRARKAEARKPKTIYMSQIGKPCKRQVWYEYHFPHLAEPMLGSNVFKFMYGDLIEDAALFLAEEAGHKVARRQHEVTWSIDGWRISGRIDAEIDGVLVDVKGMSPFGYKKFEEGLTDENDSFGYRMQLGGYNAMQTWTRQGFLAIDKQNGKVGWFEQPIPDVTMRYQGLSIGVATAIKDTIAAISDAGIPARGYVDQLDGKSGNRKLCIECSYCPFKQACWADANGGTGLTAWAYSYGPVFLTQTGRVPAVPRITLPAIPAAHPTTTTIKRIVSAAETESSTA